MTIPETNKDVSIAANVSPAPEIPALCLLWRKTFISSGPTNISAISFSSEKTPVVKTHLGPFDCMILLALTAESTS